LANIILFTEQFDNSWWVKNDGATVTQDTHAAPAFAGFDAGLADTLHDAQAVQTSIYSPYITIANDASAWTASVFMRKDAVTSRYPLMVLEFNGGTGIWTAASFGTSDGSSSDFPGFPPAARGVVDVDDTWWRMWMRQPNNNTGNVNVRMGIFPASSTVLGGSGDGGVLGTIVAWGANISNSSVVEDYIPEPFYQVPVIGEWITLTTYGAAGNAHIDTAVENIMPHREYDYRVLATNAAGSTASNTDSEEVGGDVNTVPGSYVSNIRIG
jgi:hypothetical protein